MEEKIQAILPLRGKVINTRKARLEDILKMKKLILSFIQLSVGNDFKIEDSNYNRIIIMTDADIDGAHIQVLLLTFFLSI